MKIYKKTILPLAKRFTMWYYNGVKVVTGDAGKTLVTVAVKLNRDGYD